MHENGLHDLASFYFGEVERMVENLGRLLEACRAARIQVAYSHLASDTADGRNVPWRMRHLGLLASIGTKESQILEHLAPHPHDLVLPRTTLSVFTPHTGDQVLRNLGVNSLIITGALTDASIASTTRDAGDRGYRTVVVEDACVALSAEDHRDALVPIDLWYAGVVTTEAALSAIREGTTASQQAASRARTT